MITKGTICEYNGPRGRYVKSGDEVEVLSNSVTPASLYIRVRNTRTRREAVVSFLALSELPDSSHADRV